MAAPFPPPAKPPTIAPNAVPPPAIAAVRFPLPFFSRLIVELAIDTLFPFNVMEVSLSSSKAPPFNLPRGAASTTVPRTDVPAGITIFPSTVMPEVSVALKESPGELIFDPTALPNRTVRALPTGTITGCGAGAAAGADEASVVAEAGAVAGVAELDGAFIVFPESGVADPEFVVAEFAGEVFAGAAALLAEFDVVSAGLREQATNVTSKKMEIHRARERIRSSSGREFVEAKTLIEAAKPVNMGRKLNNGRKENL
jgi:hypothetical protein